MTTVVLHPLDTLFFRDGRPYNQGDPSQVEAVSLFPPHPPSIVGAVRAALARSMGWPGKPWNAAVLGTGVDWQAGDDALGPLRFAGPYILRNGEPLFPALLSLVAGREETSANCIVHLAPSLQPLETDLGAVRLPRSAMPAQGFKPLEGYWLDGAAMARALSGVELCRDHAVPGSHLAQVEPRVGIRRDAARRTTAEGELYAAAHVRPARDVTLAVEIEGLPSVSLNENLAPFGGEGRSAWIKKRNEKIRLPEAPDLYPDKDSTLRYIVCLITPADLGEEWPGPGGSLMGSTGEALPGRIVSARTGRAVMIGGWNGLTNGPLPLRPLIPAGSVWFLEAKSGEARAAKSWHGRAIGYATGWGFGRVLIGRWEPAREGT